MNIIDCEGHADIIETGSYFTQETVGIGFMQESGMSILRLLGSIL